MTVYDNRNERSKITSVDFSEKDGLAFIYLKHVGDRDDVKKQLAEIGQEVVAETRINTLPVFVTRGAENKEELFSKLKTHPSDNFEKHVPRKKGLLGFLQKHGWTIRGISSFVGQGMTFVSAKIGVNEDGTKKPFESSTGLFAVFNLAANAINVMFGGQKERDAHGLEHLSRLISEEVNRHLPEGSEHKLAPDDLYKTEYMNGKEKSDLAKEDSLIGRLKRNSVWFGEVGLRTIGSVCMLLSPGDWKFKNWRNSFGELFKNGPKAAWDMIKVKDPLTFWAGAGFVVGKGLALSAQAYDPKNEPKDEGIKGYISELRQKVFWKASSVIEFFAQNVVAYDRFANKKISIGGKVSKDWVGGVGNIALAEIPYPVRVVLPYGRVELDTKEVQARLVNALTQIPKEEVSTVAARITARMSEYMGDKSPEFSVLYGQVIEKLEKHHNIPLTAKPFVAEPILRNLSDKEQKAEKTEAVQQKLPEEAANSPVHEKGFKPIIATRDGEKTKQFADTVKKKEIDLEEYKTKAHQPHENLVDVVDTSRLSANGAAVGA